MSEQAQRSVQLSEIATLLQRGGDFQVESRYGRAPDASFVPWGRNSFKPAPIPKPPEPRRPIEPEATTEKQQTAEEPPKEASATSAEAKSSTDAQAAPHQQTPAPPPPPAASIEAGPSPEEIIAAIERAKEDGRALGYQQGVDATRKEIGASLSTLRKLEAQLTTLTQDAVQRNADIMAHHVRRIAQELFGAVFAEMPTVFVERIKSAAEMFTKAGGEFTLAMNPHDLLALSNLISENEIFEKIRIIEDAQLQSGAFHLFSRDLDYEDAPQLSDQRSE